MSDEEVEQLKILLNKYASEELDQWERWIIHSSHGPVFIKIDRHQQPYSPGISKPLLWDDITLRPPKK